MILTVLPPAAPAPTAPAFIEPMLASKLPIGLDADSYDPAEFVMEEKFDGIRLVVRVAGGRVRSWSRLGNLRTLSIDVMGQLARMPDGVYDGELIEGSHSYDVHEGAALVLFDLLETLGRSAMHLSQTDRRRLLETAYSPVDVDGPVSLTVQQAPSVAGVVAIWARGGEGTIIKRRSACYRPGHRTADWVKVKARRR